MTKRNLTGRNLSVPPVYTDSKSVKEFRSFEVYVIRIGQLGGALEYFSGFCSFCSRAPPRDCRT